MSAYCNCGDVPTALADVGLGTPENIGLIRRFAFQRKYSAADTLNEFDTVTNDPTLKASWDIYQSAADGTKIVFSPLVDEVTATAGGPIEYEQSNQVPIKVAEGVYTLEMKAVAIDATTHAALKALECEPSQPTKAAIYLINECGNIWGQSTDALVTDYRGFDIEYLHVDGDITEFAFDSPQKVNIKMVLKANWSKQRIAVEPADFNALEVYA